MTTAGDPYSHSQHVLQQLSAQLEFGFLCDVIVRIGEVYFRAHRVVLAACCAYFHKLFVNQPNLASCPQISYTLNPEHVRPEHFDVILQMMYKGVPHTKPIRNELPGLHAAMSFLEFYNIPEFLHTSNAKVSSALLYGVETFDVQEVDTSDKGESGEKDDIEWKPAYLCSLDGFHMAKVKSHKTEKKVESPLEIVEEMLEKDCLYSQCSSRLSPTNMLRPHPGEARCISSAGLKEEPRESSSFLEVHGIKVVQINTESEAESQKPTRQPVSSSTNQIQEDPLQCETNLTTKSAKKLEEFHQLKSEKSELAWNERNVSLTAEPGQSQSASTSICSEFTSSPSISKLTESSVFAFAHKSPSTFPCSRCEISFNTPLALDDHLNNCGRERPSRQRRIPSRLRQSPSPPVLKRNSTLKDPYSVEVELEDFSSFQTWNSSRGKLSCKTCGKVFKRPKMFQLHNIRCSERPADLGQSRPEVRNHICNVCGKAFLQRGHLTEHEATHSNIRRFSCSTCGKKFIRNRELKIHEARHEGQATYHCQFCGHASYRKSGHYHHLVTHLAKPQVICQTCFHICDTPMLLKEHELEHRHTCERCGVKFRLKKELLTHYDSCR
ncbi:zinc finger and BTB domain-containing protein 1-like [Erpetoichthys calabaricus]|uniref:zinc finger and BTB domain-containing protein 1-like n=1 Tax=Erpetoichthys calabaricus TaxID=27687 RepID=UPI0022343144|nr:zinc finger and BTB domain-containing protein 1-like [Erpetoichthys calabaricus]